MEKTKKIITPIAKVEVIMNDWITGGEAEYIDEALMAGVEMKPDMANKTASFGKFDTKAIVEQAHREIEKFVVLVGESKDVLKEVLALPEADYEFIRAEIAKRRKKKIEIGQD